MNVPLLVLVLAAGAGAAPHRLVPARVTAVPGTSNATYRARAAGVEVRLRNYYGDADPKGFSEPPFEVTAKGGRTCLAEPGNARRDGVWISADGRLVAFAGWSGSSESLEVFETATCRRTALVDTTGGATVDGTIVAVAGGPTYRLTSAGALEEVP